MVAYGAAVAISAQQNPVYWVLEQAAHVGNSATISVSLDWSATLQQAARTSLPALWLAVPVVAWLGYDRFAKACSRLGQKVSRTITSVKDRLNPPFMPQYSVNSTAGPTPVYEYIELAKKQLLRIRVTMDEAMIREYVVVVIRGASSSVDQQWIAGRVLKDCPKVGHGDVVRFRSPSSGRYVLAITSRQGYPVRLTLEFDKVQ